MAEPREERVRSYYDTMNAYYGGAIVKHFWYYEPELEFLRTLAYLAVQRQSFLVDWKFFPKQYSEKIEADPILKLYLSETKWRYYHTKHPKSIFKRFYNVILDGVDEYDLLYFAIWVIILGATEYDETPAHPQNLVPMLKILREKGLDLDKEFHGLFYTRFGLFKNDWELDADTLEFVNINGNYRYTVRELARTKLNESLEEDPDRVFPDFRSALEELDEIEQGLPGRSIKAARAASAFLKRFHGKLNNNLVSDAIIMHQGDVVKAAGFLMNPSKGLK